MIVRVAQTSLPSGGWALASPEIAAEQNLGSIGSEFKRAWKKIEAQAKRSGEHIAMAGFALSVVATFGASMAFGPLLSFASTAAQVGGKLLATRHEANKAERAQKLALAAQQAAAQQELQEAQAIAEQTAQMRAQAEAETSRLAALMDLQRQGQSVDWEALAGMIKQQGTAQEQSSWLPIVAVTAGIMVTGVAVVVATRKR